MKEKGRVWKNHEERNSSLGNKNQLKKEKPNELRGRKNKQKGYKQQSINNNVKTGENSK